MYIYLEEYILIAKSWYKICIFVCPRQLQGTLFFIKKNKVCKNYNAFSSQKGVFCATTTTTIEGWAICRLDIFLLKVGEFFAQPLQITPQIWWYPATTGGFSPQKGVLFYNMYIQDIYNAKRNKYYTWLRQK